MSQIFSDKYFVIIVIIAHNAYALTHSVFYYHVTGRLRHIGCLL